MGADQEYLWKPPCQRRAVGQEIKGQKILLYVYNEAATEAIKMQLLQKRGVAIGLRADSYNQQTLTGEPGKYISEN